MVPTLRPVMVAPSFTLLLLQACSGAGQEPDVAANRSAPDDPEPLFVSLDPASSGITFKNAINENQQQNYYVYEYMYNGGGVAVGDINGDGLPDIYFTGNLVPDRLYLNKGDMQFEDITETAIPGGQDGWHSGVTMADVNNDGLLDIYVCRAGWYDEPEQRTNLLYLNNGDLTFKEVAQAWGVADTTRSTQAAFFDMDKDGDLDLFVINTPLQKKRQYSNIEIQQMVEKRVSPSDRLYRNDGDRFTDITAEAGIWNMGYGLGVAISDLDGNGWPDIYVSNDYIERDFMYLNQGDGTFRDEILERTRHISNFGMGCDVADYNNDALPDIVVVDMVSEDHVRSKKNMSGMSTDRFWKVVQAGYHLQYMFNTLQLNNGNGTFSDVGQLAGMSKTDWSWSPLLADLDNDGWKDLLVTNGYKRDMRDNDFMRATKELAQDPTNMTFERVFSLVPANRVRNYLYRNKGDLRFENVSVDWGFKNSVNSNGAAYGDLDGDGDLDLVINNMDVTAEVYENQASDRGLGRSIRVLLEGREGALAYGARVHLTTPDGNTQYQELMPTRGYQSSVEPVLHFGVGEQAGADLRVEWPDGMVSELSGVSSGTVQVDRSTARRPGPTPKAPELFASVADQVGLGHRHVENTYNDFAHEVLLPHKQSENGPLMATADMNGDGLADLFVGGARGQSGTLFTQLPNGTFRKASSQPWSSHADREDLGALFFDADGDGDPDLFVASGSNEVDLTPDQYKSRLYMNQGGGRYRHSDEALPMLQTSAMRAAAADVDGDGDLDLFVGGRVVPGQYPRAPRSYLLLNDGSGRFADATDELAPDLASPGMVTDLAFLDHDSDGDPDLFLVGEWMPLTCFVNEGGRFTNGTGTMGLSDTEGWWFSLEPADLDSDGDLDLVCGNIGWNSKFHGTPDHPVHLFWNDFDGNGRGDIVLAKDHKGELVPVRGRECSSQQCPMILDRFATYDAFANADLGSIYGQEKLGEALHLQARHMTSCVLINEGNGRWRARELPMEAQRSPIMGTAVADWNGDGHPDLVIAGNHWGAEVETIRYDGGVGMLLLGDGQGGFKPVATRNSGIFAWNNAKDVLLLPLGTAGTPAVVVANNNAPLQVFRPEEVRSLLSAR